MNTTIVLLRVLHIGFGAFWVGSDIFLTFLFLPRLRTLGEHIERPVLLAIMRIVPPAMMLSSIITAGSGLALAGTMRGWNVASFLANNWGIAILVGFAGTLIALIVGFGLIPPVTIRAEKLSRAFEGRQPTAAEVSQLGRLAARATMLSKVNALLLIVVVISMAVARYV